MIEVAMTTDSAFAPWAATTIRSLLDQHADTPITLHILFDAGLEVPDRDRLRGLTAATPMTIAFHAVDAALLDRLDVPARERIVWWRLFLPNILSDVDRVVFLDADTFVARPITELWRLDLGPHRLAAVANVLHPSLHDHARSIGVDDPLRYLNAGVLLLDLEAMRRADDVPVLVDMAVSIAGRMRFADQDVLNAVYSGRYLELHPRWNTMNALWTWHSWATEVFGTEAVEDARSRPAILHFEGPHISKPWHYLNGHPWRAKYRETLERTPWSGRPLDGRNIVTTAIHALPSRWWLPAFTRWLRWRKSIGTLVVR